MTAIRTLTSRAASADTLADADYRDIYQEVRGYDQATGQYRLSLRGFTALIQARFPGEECLSIAYWSKYHNNLTALSRRARNELRALVGLPGLPPTVAEATADVDPDATVYQVGDDPADRVILVGADQHDPLTLTLDGYLTVDDGGDPPGSPLGDALASHVTAVTPPRSRKPTKAIRLSPDKADRLNALRKEAAMTWDEIAGWILELCGG